MQLSLLLLPHTQPGYEQNLLRRAEAVEAILGPQAFDGAAVSDIPERIARGFHEPHVDPGAKLHLAESLHCFAWWCGLEIAPHTYRRIGELVRSTLAGLRPQPSEAARPASPDAPRHNLFVGALIGPLHSPSRGAVDYARALAALPEVRRIDVYHTGPVPPAMLAYMQESLGGAAAEIRLGDTRHPDLAMDLRQVGGVNHVWCESAFAPHLAMAQALGPTLMFTCGDAAPYQYADVYWYFREPPYIEALWSRLGVPAEMIANYVASLAGPNDDRLRPSEATPKARLGLDDGALLLASVGNRLAVDFDASFVNGVEAALRTHPGTYWMVVGALPAPMLDACRAVLGERFLHRAYEPELGSLMTAVDIFLNPFRVGGGDSAMRALSGGALVLARGDKGDVAALVPPHHRQPDAATYFRTLADLIADPALRRAWGVDQARRAARLADQAVFGADLSGMIRLACERWNRRTLATPGPTTTDRAREVA